MYTCLVVFNFPMHLFSKPGYIVQLGDSAESKFDSIQFTIFASLGAEAIYELWSALSNVLAKSLTVISLRLAVNAQ